MIIREKNYPIPRELKTIFLNKTSETSMNKIARTGTKVQKNAKTAYTKVVLKITDQGFSSSALRLRKELHTTSYRQIGDNKKRLIIKGGTTN